MWLYVLNYACIALEELIIPLSYSVEWAVEFIEIIIITVV